MWEETIGLVNGLSRKFLTAETFGNKVNSNGTVFRRKQQWSLEPFSTSEPDSLCIRSHLNRYLSVDQFGNVTCDTEQKNERCRFHLSIHQQATDETGRPGKCWWIFRNLTRGYLLGCDESGEMRCRSKQATAEADLWEVQLQPGRGTAFFALKSNSRRRFARFKPEPAPGRVQMDAGHAWGERTLFQLRHLSGCNYALQTIEGSCLRNDGLCEQLNEELNFDQLPIECHFTIEVAGGTIAFRDFRGLYLTGGASASLLKSKGDCVTKDEQFELQSAPLQVQLRASFNGKWLSTRQGVDLTANQGEIGDDHETFELQYDVKTQRWQVSNKCCTYWTLSGSNVAGNGTQATAFRIHWQQNGSCSFEAISNDEQKEESRWICARKSGQLFVSTSNTSSVAACFWMRVANRRFISLRPLNGAAAANGTGFVGLRMGETGRLDCNKSLPENIELVYIEEQKQDETKEDESLVETTTEEPKQAKSIILEKQTLSFYHLRLCANKRFWSVSSKQLISCDSDQQATAYKWTLEFRSDHELAIRSFEEQNSYVGLNGQGLLQLIHCQTDKAPLWDF